MCHLSISVQSLLRANYAFPTFLLITLYCECLSKVVLLKLVVNYETFTKYEVI